MLFVVDKLLWMLLRPSTFLLLVQAVGLILVRLRRGRAGWWLVTSPTLALLAILLLPVDQWIVSPLEDRFPTRPPLPEHPAGIVVLGGAVDTTMTAAHGLPALNDAAERMTAFVGLARRFPEAKLAFAGGSGRVIRGGLTEADVARMLFEQLGLDRPVIYDSRSRDTYQNATLLHQEVHPGRTAWILVTSASHMPRAVGVFRKAGWTVIPWPVDYKTGGGWRANIGSSLPARLAQVDWGVHEWLGLLAYRVLGRTDALFPAP